MASRLHRTSREPSFEIVKQLQPNGQFRTTLEVSCAKCHRLEKIPWTSAPVPDFIKRKMTALGWTFDPLKKSACVCPACNRRAPTPAELGDALAPSTSTSSEAMLTTSLYRPESAPLTPDSEPIGKSLRIKTRKNPPKEERMVQTTPPTPMHIVRGPKFDAAREQPRVTGESLVADTPPLPRSLTPDERLRVRNLLDTNFDDSAGYYISGYSDQRIGTELNIPWAAVAQIREAAYGPLREDERLTQLRTEFASLKADYNKLDAALKAEINRQLREFNTKLTTIENKLKEMDHG